MTAKTEFNITLYPGRTIYTVYKPEMFDRSIIDSSCVLFLYEDRTKPAVLSLIWELGSGFRAPLTIRFASGREVEVTWFKILSDPNMAPAIETMWDEFGGFNIKCDYETFLKYLLSKK
jgi:hypothetical protein